MRFFRGRDQSGESGRRADTPESVASEPSPKRSIFRNMSMLFSRSSSLSNDTSNSGQRSPANSTGVSNAADKEHALRRSQIGVNKFGYTRHSDLGHINWEGTPLSDTHAGGKSHSVSSLSEDETSTVERITSSASLTLSPLCRYVDPVTREGYTTLDQVRLGDDGIYRHKQQQHYSNQPNRGHPLGYPRFPTAPFESSQLGGSEFEIKHSNSFSMSHLKHALDGPLWLDDANEDASAKVFKRVVKQKSFFNIKNKISAFRRNAVNKSAAAGATTPSAAATSLPIGTTGTEKQRSELESLMSRVNVLPQRLKKSKKDRNTHHSPPASYARTGSHSENPHVTFGNQNVIDGVADGAAIDGIGSWRCGDSLQPSIGTIGSSVSASSQPHETVIKLTSATAPDAMTINHFSPDDAAEAKRIEETFSCLPLLKETPVADRPELFQKKLIACQTLVDFDVRKKQQRAIELKRQTLLEIIDYISTTRNSINERVLQDVIDMLEANVFRSLPPKSHNFQLQMYLEYEDEEHQLEKSWPHLQIVYDVFLRVIVSNEISSKMAKNVIDKPFVMKLLATLESEDQRERDYLKTIIHRIYGKIMPLRTFIRKAMDNVFTHFIYESENYHGINELLEILGSIINGFAIPLKEEHKIYLAESLLPLHRTKSVRTYHAALTYCMMQYISKDRTLAALIIKEILRYWPVENTAHEILFLNELEEVLTQTETSELLAVLVPLTKRLTTCVSSMHFQVAERALYMWNNERLSKLLAANKKLLESLLLPAIEYNIKHHWNAAVKAQSHNIRKLLEEPVATQTVARSI